MRLDIKRIIPSTAKTYRCVILGRSFPWQNGKNLRRNCSKRKFLSLSRPISVSKASPANRRPSFFSIPAAMRWNSRRSTMIRASLPVDRLLLAMGLASLALVLGALGFQYIGGVQPCEMCQWQRWPHLGVAWLGLAVAPLWGTRMRPALTLATAFAAAVA